MAEPTNRNSAHPGDGQKVRLLPGTEFGHVNEVIVLSTNIAKEEIRLGRATPLE